MNKETKQFEFKMTGIDDTGTFSGYASIWDQVDAYNDAVERGAFKKTLSEKRNFPLLWSHNTTEPIGVISGYEDSTGLAVTGTISLDVQRGKEIHALMKMGAVTGLSIGYQTIKEQMDRASGVRRLKEIKLYEISPVVLPACDGARIAEVKAEEEAEAERREVLRLLDFLRL